jgi:hypothetical protein
MEGFQEQSSGEVAPLLPHERQMRAAELIAGLMPDIYSKVDQDLKKAR